MSEQDAIDRLTSKGCTDIKFDVHGRVRAVEYNRNGEWRRHGLWDGMARGEEWARAQLVDMAELGVTVP